MKRTLLTAALCGFGLASSASMAAEATATSLYLKAPSTTDPGLTSVGPLTFGQSGLLLVADPGTASIVAVDTGDTGPLEKLAKPVEDAAGLVAATLGTTADQVQIVDMAVNPASGKVWFSVRDNVAKKPAILFVDSTGKAKQAELAGRNHVRVRLPAGDSVSIRNISDLALTKDTLLVTGQSNEEFSSKIFSIPLPLAADASSSIFSAETYHVAHRKWETKAPIQSFIPFSDDGVPCVLGAFACTPLAKFPLKDIASGANVKGTSVVELGSGNRPLDLFTYSNSKGEWAVTNTLRFHQPLFGPSKYWGVRISLGLLKRKAPEQTNENALRRDVKQPEKTEGIEILEVLHGATQVDKLNEEEMIVLRETGDKLRIELCKLP